MTYRLSILLLLLAGLFVWSKPAHAQDEQTVSGVVTDEETGEPLPGANVQLASEPSIGTATGADGQYSLTVPSLQDTLMVSYIGFETNRVAIAGRTNIDVPLTTATIEGEELVVVGYTEERRRDITGAVSVVGDQELADRQVGTIEKALKGRMAGVRVESTGEPGVGASITVRGSAFASGSNSPLYVVDGVYTGQNPNLNPDDVESIRVLKDASAAAQYGSQAANGVVLITTKKGSASGEPDVSFRSYVGYENVPNRIDMAGAEEWARIMAMSYQNVGRELPRAVTNPEEYADTDWQDELLKTGTIQNYSLSVQGGSESSSYLISGNYFDQEGTVIDSPFKRYTARVNSEVQRGIFTFGESATFVRSVKNNITGAPLVLSVQNIPTVAVYDSSRVGGFGVGSNPDNEILVGNPVGDQYLSENNNYYNRLLGNAYGEAQILDNLSYRLNLGLEYTELTNENFRRQGIVRMNDPLEPASYRETIDNVYNLQVENLLNFNDTFGDHSINAVVGYREARDRFENLTAYREGYFDEDLQQIGAGGTDGAETGGSQTTVVRRSFLSRANYGFRERYLLSGTFRRDGASNFGANRRWGNFYAGSVGWVLSEESFYESIPVLGQHVNFFKVRGSYGVLGNSDIGAYSSQAVIRQNVGYTLGPGERLAPGAIQMALANDDLQWQGNEQTNIGLDLQLFNSAMSFEANYYISNSNNLLVQSPLPGSLGVSSDPFVNAGDIQNRGFEFSLGYGMVREELNLDLSANLTLPQNEVLSIGNNNEPIFSGPFGVSRTAVGGPVGALYVLETDGLFQQGDNICYDNSGQACEAGTAFQTTETAPGDVRFVDQNGDGIINDQDRTVAGSAVPDFEGGLRVAGNYKAFDFSVSLRGAYGNELFNVPRYWNAPGTGGGIRSGVEPWTPENTDTDIPRALPNGVAAGFNNQASSDRWIEDASYLRLQNVEVGYDLSLGRVANVMGVSNPASTSLRVYLSVENALTLTGYSNWDPTTPGQGVLAPAVDDLAIYPTARTFTFGLDLNL